MIRLLTFLFLLLPLAASAANHYVRDGGSGDGSAWDNALDDLPSTLTRGDTYYIADGTYAGYAFDDAESGSTLITIRKATAADHGTETGWSSGYGDGEAIFTSSGDTFTFTRGFYLIDGATGTGKNPGGFGFRITSTASRESTTKLVQFITNRCDGIVFEHVEFDWNNGTASGSSAVTRAWDGGSAAGAPHDGTTFRHCYVHHSSGFAFYNGYGSDNFLVEYCYFYRNGGGGGEGAHWETFWNTGVTGLTFRYNTVDNTIGTAGQTGWLMVGGCTNVAIYGNLFCATDGDSVTGNNGTIGTWNHNDFANTNVTIVNNTFVDLDDGGLADPKIYFTHSSADDTNVVIRNNLIYCAVFSAVGGDTVSHNAFGGGASAFGTTTQTGLSSSIFTNYAGDDYSLSANTEAGTDLGSPYNVDMLGNTRTTWSRGAYEFQSEGGGGGGTYTPTRNAGAALFITLE